MWPVLANDRPQHKLHGKRLQTLSYIQQQSHYKNMICAPKKITQGKRINHHRNGQESRKIYLYKIYIVFFFCKTATLHSFQTRQHSMSFSYILLKQDKF